MDTLRDYQQEMLVRLQKAWRRHRSVMVQMPTGTGKTHLMAEAVRREVAAAAQGNVAQTAAVQGCVLLVAHRRELIEQIRDTLARFGIDTEAGPVRVESIQKLGSVLKKEQNQKHDGGLKGEAHGGLEPSLVVIDEAHHALARTYRQLWERWPKARFLGLTATPCRLSGEAFTDLFDVLLQSWSIQEFIDKGWLSDFEYVSASPDSMALRRVRSLQKRGADGDYQAREMATVMDVPESVAHLYHTYRQFADGRRGIVYAIDRQHAAHIGEYYRSQGVSCAVVDCRTPSLERRTLVGDYLAGRLSVLVSVDLFGEGFDAPEVEFIQLARPTLSLSKYLQQVGRGMRISAGKPHVLILDNVGLYQTFGLPTDERDWRRTFYGVAPGKGQTGLERCVVLDEPAPSHPLQRQLVNLEMVRIKKSGGRGAGVEVFLHEGRYGVMFNGRVTCPARFKSVVRVDGRSQFFALAVFTEVQRGGSGALYMPRECPRDLFTVISKQGEDMGVRFYGPSYQIDGDFVRGDRADKNNVLAPAWWDSKTGHYYDYKPELRVIHGMEFVCEGGGGRFRHVTGAVNPDFALSGLYYNRHIALNKFHLVVRSDHNHAYRICGYLDDSIIVQNDRSYGYLQIFSNGTVGRAYTRLPHEMTLRTDYRLLGVRPVGSKPFA